MNDAADEVYDLIDAAWKVGTMINASISIVEQQGHEELAHLLRTELDILTAPLVALQQKLDGDDNGS